MSDPFIDSMRHLDDSCIGNGFLVGIDDNGHGDTGPQQFATGNMVFVQELFNLRTHESIIVIGVTERTTHSLSCDDVNVQINHNDGKMIPCNIDSKRITGMRDASEQMGFSAAGRIKSTCVIDQTVRFQLIQVVCDGWKAQTQLFGNDLAGALPVVIDQAVNIACIF